MADENPIKRIPTNQIRQEPGAHELATSPDMKPYLEFMKAVMQDHDPAPELVSDPAFAPRKAVRLAGGVGTEVGSSGLRKS
jgi:hypothetical protein